MTKRMLIDATHPEETRVVVLGGSRLDEFDFEAATRKQLKGNIYLAKITRVEPSLQAAFVEYGGNRHGFLSFNEIHPDYYQIPVSDRQALAEQEARAQAEAEDEADIRPRADDANGEDENGDGDEEQMAGEAIEEVSDDVFEEAARRRVRPSRRYKIQEVIKRRQIMLVQVVKEERGNKGAALTTYLSLAGRFSVLMPNTARGGGISRKILNPDDRKRLKAIAADLPVPEGVGVILRTAGLGRSKAEIKRDFNYLLKLWNNIREETLKSIAPTLIHEEANLINRAIRDLYSRDIEEVQVDGEAGYRMAKEFMRRLMPSHAKRVIQYTDRIPLFHRYQVEEQLDAMYSPVVQLKSGGYIVINSTEALVAIDVNSGRATRARNIEETALRTNIEAAEEVARELRLRDLSGLIVIDFIDMDEAKNNRSVERRLKEAMKIDRARIQMGHISPFGLLELSRQRLRPSLIEVSSQVCSHCGGSGHIRSIESTSLHVLRGIEEEGIRERSSEITVCVHGDVAFYILNQKRDVLSEIEQRYGFHVIITRDDELIPPDYRIERIRTRTAEAKPEDAERVEATEDDADKTGRQRRRRSKRRKEGEAEKPVEAKEAEAAAEAATVETGAGNDDEAPRKRRRRGKRGGRRRRAAAAQATEAAETETAASPDIGTAGVDEATAPSPPAAEAPPVAGEIAVAETSAPAETEAKSAKPKRARRSRKKKVEATTTTADEEVAAESAVAGENEAPSEVENASPKPAKRARRKKSEPEDATAKAAAKPTKPKRAPRTRRKKAEAADDAPKTPPAAPIDVTASEPPRATPPLAASPENVPPAESTKGPARRGWWQKLVE